MTPLRLAVYQSPSGGVRTRGDAVTALDRVVARAAAAGAGLLVTPELWTTGYRLGATPEERAEPADGPTAQAFARVARRHGVALVYGYPERGADGRVYNSAQMLSPDGDHLANYRKTHLYGADETAVFTPGDDLVVQAELGGVRVGLLICYDVEFPEAVRAHALAGTDLLAVPTALMRPYEAVATTLLPARALENQLFVAYANHTGATGAVTFTGLSCLAAPDGTTPARAAEAEDLLSAEISLSALRASRAANPYLADRRPELYRQLT